MVQKTRTDEHEKIFLWALISKRLDQRFKIGGRISVSKKRGLRWKFFKIFRLTLTGGRNEEEEEKDKVSTDPFFRLLDLEFDHLEAGRFPILV